MKGLCFNSNQLDDLDIKNYKFNNNINYGCSMRGAWRALQCMGDDVAIVIHGPEGCNNEFKLDYTAGIARTYCTNMDEKDVITGGAEKLEKVIVNIDKLSHISLIVILTTCTSELIGEDIDGLVNKLKNKVSKKFLVLHTSGISGMVQSEGHNMVISNLAKRFIKIKSKKKNSINYIGYSWPWDHRSGRDISELRNILNEIGIELNVVFTSGMTFSDLEGASGASLNVVRCPGSAYSVIKYMQDNFNIPYIKLPMPVGIENTTKFFEGLIDYFHLPPDTRKKLKHYEDFVRKRLATLKLFLDGKKVAVAVGANRTLYLVEALTELGLDIKVISFYRIHETVGNQVLDISGKTFEKLSKIIQKYNLSCKVLMYSDSKQFWEVVTDQKVEIVFDVHTNRKLIHRMGMAFSESMDVIQPYQFYYGFLSLAYDLVKELNQPFYRKYKEFYK